MKRVIILTGAGISAESGIRTFRDQNGLWEDHRIEDVATPEGFARDPQLVHAFYNARRTQLQDSAVAPNAAHLALAQLEAALGDRLLLVTQNVDNLHERAGSRRVIHMHGELLKARCVGCQAVLEWRADLALATVCPGCGATGALRPHIVWFGEMPFALDEIFEALARADVFIAIGTSGQVYPAAGFVEQVPAGARRIESNSVGSACSERFEEHVVGPASRAVPTVVKSLLA